MPRSALTLMLALTACPGLPDDTDPTVSGTDDPNPRDTQDTAPPCPEDLLEENDAAASAIRPEALPVQGQVCEGDEDWFTVAATGGCVNVVELAFGSALGDLDLEVYQGEDRLAVSSSTTDNEEARFFVEEDADVQVRVVGFFGAENAYSLDLRTECEPCEQPDPFEPNDTHETPATATFPLMADACLSDDDWYALPDITEDGCLVDATLQTVGQADTTVSLSLSDTEQLPVVDATLAAVGISLRAVARPGDRLGISATANGAYDLDAQVTCPTAPPACASVPPDIWANDTLSTAVMLRDGVVVSAAACGSEPGWWSVPYREGCTTVVTVDASSASASVNTNSATAPAVTVSGPTPVATVTTAEATRVRVNRLDSDTTYTVQADILCDETE